MYKSVYMNIKEMKRFSNKSFSERTGMQTYFVFTFELLLRPRDLSHRVQRQKLMVDSQEEMCVCVSGEVVLWLTYFYVRVLVPMFYLKLCNV